jgi:hypothetical protein
MLFMEVMTLLLVPGRGLVEEQYLRLTNPVRTELGVCPYADDIDLPTAIYTLGRRSDMLDKCLSPPIHETFVLL